MLHLYMSSVCTQQSGTNLSLAGVQQKILRTLEHSKGAMDFSKTWLLRDLKAIVTDECKLPGCSLHLEGDEVVVVDAPKGTKLPEAKSHKAEDWLLEDVGLATPDQFRQNLKLMEKAEAKGASKQQQGEEEAVAVETAEAVSGQKGGANFTASKLQLAFGSCPLESREDHDSSCCYFQFWFARTTIFSSSWTESVLRTSGLTKFCPGWSSSCSKKLECTKTSSHVETPLTS